VDACTGLYAYPEDPSVKTCDYSCQYIINSSGKFCRAACGGEYPFTNTVENSRTQCVSTCPELKQENLCVYNCTNEYARPVDPLNRVCSNTCAHFYTDLPSQNVDAVNKKEVGKGEYGEEYNFCVPSCNATFPFHYNYSENRTHYLQTADLCSNYNDYSYTQNFECVEACRNGRVRVPRTGVTAELHLQRHLCLSSLNLTM
jgi:hypothetical protein